MKEDLMELIFANNTVEKGIRISIPLGQYVDKILLNATIIPYYVNGNLKGTIAYYNNDVTKMQSFLTLILIAHDYQRKGLGKLLLQMSIEDLKSKGFENYSLEVLKINSTAIKLYEEFDFRKLEDRSDLWLMTKTLV